MDDIIVLVRIFDPIQVNINDKVFEIFERLGLILKPR